MHLPPLASRRLFVAAQPHPELGQAVIVVIEGTPLPDLPAHLAGRELSGLRRYEIPRQIYFVPRFAETPRASSTGGQHSPLPGYLLRCELQRAA